MKIPETPEFIDELVEEKTGTSLTDLQIAVLEGTLKGQKYADIGDKNGFTEGHVRDVGYKLLQLLSSIFNKSLNKHNLKKFLEKQNNIDFKNCKNFLNGNKITYSYNELLSDSQEIGIEVKKYNKAKHQVQIEMAKKLKNKGLSGEEIADILEIEVEELDDYLQ